MANPGQINAMFIYLVDLSKPNLVLAIIAGLVQYWQTKMLIPKSAPKTPGTTKGPSTTVRCHGAGDEVTIGAISACLRRLGIASNDFWE